MPLKEFSHKNQQKFTIIFSSLLKLQEKCHNSSHFPSLMEILRTNCTDIEESSTTTTQITTIPTEEPSCGDICDLEEQNSILKIKIEEMDANMNEKLTELSQENSQIKEMLNEVLEGILELSSRP